MVTCGRDGRVILWDVIQGVYIREFVVKHNNSHQPLDALDATFNAAGTLLAVSDLWGHYSLFGVGNTEMYKNTPTEQFFNIDAAGLLQYVVH